ncbi:hypothetical protein [Lentzea jiangxiensis]|uniref:Uncharacterized protein n=1 Tax=Lentzea jiangxiensis TaxID=641025 RepID=A0A1H0UJU9_9PSEU|nr:hypothetical protein [Lentzea jiangxiensis]SDP66444.1 hypothetical protein SAMN05421507_11264 [Lentzea jiangxiensis]
MGPPPENAGVTPEDLLRDFGSLVDAQTKSLRGLAMATDVGLETIRGWKDMGRFPRSTDDFMKVVRTCLQFLKPEAPQQRWRVADWEARYHEAKRAWENREGDRRPQKPIPVAFSEPTSPRMTTQVYGGDYVNGAKNSVHFGDVNHHHPDQSGR